MHRSALWMVVGLVAFEIASGCGDDDDDMDSPDGGSKMDGGASSRVDSGRPDAGRGGTPPAMTSAKCGTKTCMAPPAMGPFTVGACCADEATSTCGLSSMGAACAAPVEPDPRCPSLDFMGFMVASCCTADGQCGIDATNFGMPCISLEQAAGGAMSMGAGFGIEFPEPRGCGEGEDAGAGDAGSADGGGSDAGSADGGGSDAGSADGGGSDAGSADGGGSDAGSADGGGSDAAS